MEVREVTVCIMHARCLLHRWAPGHDLVGLQMSALFSHPSVVFSNSACLNMKGHSPKGSTLIPVERVPL